MLAGADDARQRGKLHAGEQDRCHLRRPRAALPQRDARSTSVNITDGVCTGTGTATHFAAVDTGTRLLARGTLHASVALILQEQFSLPPDNAVSVILAVSVVNASAVWAVAYCCSTFYWRQKACACVIVGSATKILVNHFYINQDRIIIYLLAIRCHEQSTFTFCPILGQSPSSSLEAGGRSRGQSPRQ